MQYHENPVVDECIRELSVSKGGKLIELGDLGDDASMKAGGLFSHSGVAAHPGDRGMRVIADRIYETVRSGRFFTYLNFLRNSFGVLLLYFLNNL